MGDVPERDASAVHAEALELGDERRGGAGLALDVDVPRPAVLVDADGQRRDAKPLFERAIVLEVAGQVRALELVPVDDVGQASVGLTERQEALHEVEVEEGNGWTDQTVYGIYVTGFADNVAYRKNQTKGVAIANQAEAMYMVVDATRFSSFCSFDYGNAETNSKDDGNGTIEAIYWGTDTAWGGFGVGNGPWVAADLENGMFKGNKGGFNYGATNPTPRPTAQSVIAKFATTMLKGPSDNTFALKAASAQSGSLTTMWNSSRPSPNYSPKNLQGAIILGTGGDGSNGGTGTFFEGAMTSGNPPDAVDDAVQANVVSAGYGR